MAYGIVYHFSDLNDRQKLKTHSTTWGKVFFSFFYFVKKGGDPPELKQVSFFFCTFPLSHSLENPFSQVNFKKCIFLTKASTWEYG